MVFLCWSTVYDAGPTLNQHWFNVLCLLDLNIRLFNSNVSHVKPNLVSVWSCYSESYPHVGERVQRQLFHEFGLKCQVLVAKTASHIFCSFLGEWCFFLQTTDGLIFFQIRQVIFIYHQRELKSFLFNVHCCCWNAYRHMFKITKTYKNIQRYDRSYVE